MDGVILRNIPPMFTPKGNSQSYPGDASKLNGEVAQKATKYRFVIGGLIAFLAWSLGLGWYITGPITPLLISHYGISNSTAGFLTSIVFLVHIVFAIPLSMLVSRVGLKMLLVLGALAASAQLLSFMATTSFPLLLGLRAIHGMGFIFLFTTIGPLFMQWFHPKELPLANGVFVIAVSLGITTSTFVVAPLSEVIGWEVVLSLSGGMSLVSAFIWIVFGKAHRMSSHVDLDPGNGNTLAGIRSRDTWLLAIGDAGPFTLLTVSLAWLPTFYNEVYGMSLTNGGALMGLMSLAGFVALIFSTLLSGRTHKRRPFLIIPGIVAGFAGFAAFLLADSPGIYVAVAALGFACWFFFPVLATIPMELYPNNPLRVSLIFATILTAEGIFGFIAPPTVGAIADITGSLVPGLAIFSVLAWSLVAAGILLPEPGPTFTLGKGVRSLHEGSKI